MTAHFDDSFDSHIHEGQNLKEQISGERNTSIDSGMDDSMNQDPEDHEDNEEEAIITHKKKTKRMIIEDDDDEEDNEVEESHPDSPASQALSEHTNNPNSSDDEDPKLEFDGLDENEDDVRNKNVPVALELANPVLSGEENEETNNESGDDQGVLRIDLKDRDLFDAESDEENQQVDQSDEEKGEDHDSDANVDAQADEGFEESQIDPKLLAKLKKMKGASKTAKQRENHSRKAKPTADQMSEAFSDSQRLLRDSRVNIPYYEPETKSLDDFLARASQKRQEYSSLSRPKDIQKALIIHERLAVKVPKRPSYSRDKSKNELVKADNEIDSCVPQDSLSKDEELPTLSFIDSGVDSQNAEASQPDTVILEPEQEEELSQFKASDSSQLTHDENGTNLKNLETVDSVDASSQVVEKVNVAADNETLASVDDACTQSPSKIDHSSLEDSEHDPLIQGDSESMKLRETLSQENLDDHQDLQSNPSLDLFASLSTEGLDTEPSHVRLSEEDSAVTKEADLSSDFKSPDSRANRSLSDSQTGSQITSAKKSSGKLALLEKLKQQGATLPSMPKLSGSPDSVIMLEEGEKASETPKSLGVRKLIERLAKHSAKRKPKPAYDVNFSIIEKEGESDEKKELKMKSLTYHVESEKEELPSTAPGSKLLLLKESLGKGMRQKREESRLRKQEMYNMENEEGYERDGEDKDDEEEEEMTDEPDTDEEEDDEDDIMQFDDMMDDDDDGKDYNPLLDTEAREDDDEDVNGYTSFEEETNDVPLRLELSDDDDGEDNSGDDGDEDGDDDDDDSVIMKKKKSNKNKSKVLQSDSEEEEISSLLNNKKKSDSHKETDFDLNDSWRGGFAQTSKTTQDNRFCRESSRSPELYGPSTLDESESSSTRLTDTFNDSVSSFNPHSQMLDADGYLKITQTQKPRSRIGMLVNTTQDERTALDIFQSTGKVSASNIFDGANSQVVSQDDNMAELMGLCSGKFQVNPDSDEELNPSQNKKPSKQTGFDNALDDYDPFSILSDNEETDKSHKRIKPMLSDSEEDAADDDDDDDGEKDLFTTNNDKKKDGGLLGKSSKRLRREFFEDEAELSGSEFDSDENVDLAEEDDILEEEEGDRDMAGVSNEVLRDQVGRVHMKQLQDEDDREVMRFKEMYLQDGDLHGEGGGRIRNFRWKDMEESSQQDIFGHASDQEGEEEDKEEKWRKERFEREKFIQESEQADGANEGSQFAKLGQLFLKRQDSSCSDKPQLQSQTSLERKKSKLRNTKLKGSFLARGKEALGKIAAVAKTVLGGNSNKSSRNFLFQSVESQSNQEDQEEPLPNPSEPSKRKAHPNAQDVPVAKKPKVIKSNSQEKPKLKQQNSIFNLLNK